MRFAERMSVLEVVHVTTNDRRLVIGLKLHLENGNVLLEVGDVSLGVNVVDIGCYSSCYYAREPDDSGC